MTETVGTAGTAGAEGSGGALGPEGAQGGAQGGAQPKRALRVERVYTTEGRHPYDEVNWERRDVVMTNWRDGQVNFEQRGVEFPDFWSVNATNIVTSKYFRGAAGTEQRESSLRQLIDRVVGTYTAAGLEHGYFSNETDAEIFSHELTWMLLHQVFSFNSPVWFNVGTDSPAQCSACFILSVDDTMESILNWYREEGLIFKGGSGAGLNLSRIRSSKELLSSGGTASGPVSFMRGADASAGTIKSGGATRRAAKMVVLDVDHPDIGEFVATKAAEERKVKVLRDAGYDMDLGGKDITSVQYQNANNSVRVSDDFMRAVETDGEFGLRARMTGEVIETVRAKDLFRDITQAAWECADPGLQYDDTINDWHTCPESGRITASNPCSEFLHLDNSSCNLASLNLMKFLRDDLTFDSEMFIKAVELVITAMDISICFADFPTEKITEVTRAFRQLGIGYANLGALLMATGHAYDSDGGRALAASITSLMTGTAYRRSAELASVVGPYDGYARNAEPHQRVMRKHAAANDLIRTYDHNDSVVQKAATRVWQEGIRIGERQGWRNSQASVIAPTGCLTGDTLVSTDRGLSRLSELGDVYGEKWQPLRARVSTDDGPRPATRFFVNGEEATRRIVSSGGYTIQGTLTHRVKVIDPDSGAWVWKRLADIVQGDVVPIQLGTFVGRSRAVPLPVLDEAYYAGDRNICVPDTVDSDLAELVGYFMGDGSLHATGVRLCVADTDPDVVERLRILSKGLFDLEPAVNQRRGYQEVVLQSVRLARWWEAAGFARMLPAAGHTGKGWKPRIPAAIREANDSEVYRAFLRGVFEADGSVLAGVPSVTTCTPSFADELRAMLLNVGFATTTRSTTTGWGGVASQVRLRNLNYAVDFAKEVGFLSRRKSGLVATERSTQTGNRDRIYLPSELWLEIVPVGHELRQLVQQSVARGRGLSRDLAERVFDATGHERVGEALEYVFEEVAANEDGGVQPTYDLSVPSNVTYVANGFISHNTIGFMMDCDTTGIEPDFSLVKYKKLVGGGSMQIVNQTVPKALAALGYQDEQTEAIVEYIAEHGHVIDAPGLRPEHYEVFDCAMGERAISPIGHVRMMAATQPFVSGAISKCVAGETLITTEDGLVRIGSLHQGEEPDSFRPEFVKVGSLGGPRKTDAFYYGGTRPVREVELRSGHRITGTSNHRLVVATSNGPTWKPLADIGAGDYVAVQYGNDMWATLPARIKGFTPSVRYGCQKQVRIPEEMTEELAFLLGAYAAEGHTSEGTWSVVITNSVDLVLDRVAAACRHVFGIEPRFERRSDRCPQVIISSKTVVEFLRYLGCGARASQKRVPDVVLQSPRNMVLAFLQGLALDGYVRVPDESRGGQCKWALCVDSRGLLDDLQGVLTNLGVVHGRINKLNMGNGKSYGEVYASGEQARRLSMLVPFVEPEKEARARRLQGRSFAQSTADVVPGLNGPQLYEAIPDSHRKGFGYLLDVRTHSVSRQTVERLAEMPGVQLPTWVRDAVRDNLHFSPVCRVDDIGEREVYDISVPTTHAFVGNGIVNHNTVNMPEKATVADVEEIYFQSWKLGLKALAIYRDNCKVGQPLSTGKSGAATTDVAKAVAEGRPVRRRLPKKRPSETVSFSVAGAEGYLTAGLYPDDGLGEIFVKMSKQGSTLAGVMDAFSMAISIALQYGVPLETYVSKFVNMRFEPAGMTDDPDIRMATSVVDYLFRRIALDYLPYEKRAQLGIFSAEERTAQLAGDAGSASDEEVDVEGMRTSVDSTPVPPAVEARPAPVSVGSSTELWELQLGKAADAPLCLTCGTKMRPAGSCYVCEGCGSTSGCS